MTEVSQLPKALSDEERQELLDKLAADSAIRAQEAATKEAGVKEAIKAMLATPEFVATEARLEECNRLNSLLTNNYTTHLQGLTAIIGFLKKAVVD